MATAEVEVVLARRRCVGIGLQPLQRGAGAGADGRVRRQTLRRLQVIDRLRHAPCARRQQPEMVGGDRCIVRSCGQGFEAVARCLPMTQLKVGQAQIELQVGVLMAGSPSRLKGIKRSVVVARTVGRDAL